MPRPRRIVRRQASSELDGVPVVKRYAVVGLRGMFEVPVNATPTQVKDMRMRLMGLGDEDAAVPQVITFKQHYGEEPIEGKPIDNTRRLTPGAQIITLLHKGNPKVPGSQAHRRFALYQDGMPVEEYLAKGGTHADLRHDRSKGFIEVT